MKLTRNLYPLLIFVIIIEIITVNAISRCETVARTLIQLENAPNNYSFSDCQFVKILFEEHQARQLNVSIVSQYETIESLDLHETEGLLADFSTPIYLSLVLSTELTENTTRVNDYLFIPSTVDSYAPDFGFFTLYHDKNKFASMIYNIKGPLDVSLVS
ncbi:uncharacterized protein LOC103575862 [Microplitis demolitor]|uniref:uncharacterized protein LOC103575862 n=1 Tax=Microplitis demolitor TaxID=69319 RepID=UPI0004CCFEC4|nr:uncharacterized protein LOC103575862 [Microplitis demolitor]